MQIKREFFCAVVIAVLLLSCSGKKSVDVSGESHPTLPFGYIDVPKAGANVTKASNALQVSGWALSESGIDSVSVYVDRSYAVDATIRIARADVQKAYPNIKQAAGWWASLPLSSVGPGAHDLLVQLKASNGAIRDLEVSINLAP